MNWAESGQHYVVGPSLALLLQGDRYKSCETNHTKRNKEKSKKQSKSELS